MTWTVSVPQPFFYLNQRSSITWDGSPSEDSTLLCGPTCVAMVIKHLRDVFIPPDTIKDAILSQGAVGTTNAPQLQGFLQQYCNIPTTIYAPTVMQAKDKTGLVDIVWRYLDGGKPLISLGSLDIGGTLYPHWRVVTQLTDTLVTQADPWLGYAISEPWATQWNGFKGVLIGIDKVRPSDL